MEEVFALWEKYCEEFPTDEREVSTILNMLGSSEAKRILKRAIKTKRRIIIGDAGETDCHPIYLEGEFEDE